MADRSQASRLSFLMITFTYTIKISFGWEIQFYLVKYEKSELLLVLFRNAVLYEIRGLLWKDLSRYWKATIIQDRSSYNFLNSGRGSLLKLLWLCAYTHKLSELSQIDSLATQYCDLLLVTLILLLMTWVQSTLPSIKNPGNYFISINKVMKKIMSISLSTD